MSEITKKYFKCHIYVHNILLVFILTLNWYMSIVQIIINFLALIIRDYFIWIMNILVIFILFCNYWLYIGLQKTWIIWNPSYFYYIVRILHIVFLKWYIIELHHIITLKNLPILTYYSIFKYWHSLIIYTRIYIIC